jgi:hypothetical protein
MKARSRPLASHLKMLSARTKTEFSEIQHANDRSPVCFTYQQRLREEEFITHIFLSQKFRWSHQKNRR